MKIEILKSKNNQWYFRFVARNGRILCHSETYHRLSDAKKGARSALVCSFCQVTMKCVKINSEKWILQ